MSEYTEMIDRKRREHGEKFSDAELWPQFRPYYRTGERIRVRSASGYERTGTVGVTTGWRPAFLLIRTSRSLGSSDVLNADDTIIGVKRGREYVELATA